MYDYYGIYTACRDAAWRCQLDFEVCRLPVKVLGIARRAGIHVVKNSDVNELRKSEFGVSIFDGSSWTIVYDDTLELTEERIVIAHELGHIFLGHEYKYTTRRFAFTQTKLRSEKEADMFAVRLLAPAFALHELNITKAEDIASLCGIPKAVARERAQRMELLETRGRFYSSQLERRLLEKFEPWLIDQRSIYSKMAELEMENIHQNK
ncbi:MAG: ImmA/IrrE family metallo-endopeptidase [Clostridiales bacterium]|nr:ImmA/IrrE family metallo-endopeptidase [Clostridiales bacterium]